MGQRPPAPVLIVEDNADTRDVLERVLAVKRYHAVTAGDGLEALAYLRSGGTASVIILDLRMPNMDGYAFRRALRADPRWAEIPVIIFSAFPPDDPGDAMAVIRKGSVNPEALLALVGSVYEQRGGNPG
jgi:CheY-like chemotaxis protein